MSTKNTWIARPPKLERLLLDTDVNVQLGPLLDAVGFRVKFAFRVGANIRRDRDVLRWARTHGYIYVCHDKFKDDPTRFEIYPELYKYGGKILRLGGGPQTDILLSLGKVLIHRESWVQWFLENDGIVAVHKDKMNTWTAERLFSFVQGEMPLGADPIGTIRASRPTTHRPRRSNRPLIEQSPLDF